MIVFSVENNSNHTGLFAEAESLLDEHWQEVGAFDKKKIPLNPSWEVYSALAQQDALFIVSARIATGGSLVGYMVFILGIHHHYSDVAFAENDVMYLRAAHRKGLTGYNMIKYAIKVLKKHKFRGYPMGLIGLSMKADNSFSALVERLDFKLVDYKYFLEV